MGWNGMAWNGMAWHGMAWHGVEWNGINNNCTREHSASVQASDPGLPPCPCFALLCFAGGGSPPGRYVYACGSKLDELPSDFSLELLRGGEPIRVRLGG